LPHYLEKYNKSDVACRKVDHTHNTSTGSCQSHPLGKTNINSVNGKLPTRHTVDRGDMDTYFFMYRWSKTFIL